MAADGKWMLMEEKWMLMEDSCRSNDTAFGRFQYLLTAIRRFTNDNSLLMKVRHQGLKIIDCY